MWRIVQVFNNNVVLAQQNGEHAVLLGRAIGYKQRRGRAVDESKIHQCYVPASGQPPEQFARLIGEIAPEQLELAQELNGLAQDICGTVLPDSVVVALADHIRFAFERALAGQEFPAPLQWEVQHLYPDEYRFGKKACEHIREKFGVQLPEGEAVALALHVVNAQFDGGTEGFERTANITSLLAKVLDVVDAALPGGPGVLDRDSLATARFITHVKFLLQRMFAGQSDQDTDIGRLRSTVAEQYPEAHTIAKRVLMALAFETDDEYTDNEATYLTLHIARLMRMG